MRILLANKFFYRNAGAETVFFGTRDLLRDAGHEVIDFAMSSDRNLESPFAALFAPERVYDRRGRSPFRRIRDAAASIYSISARRAITDLVEKSRPDVAHLHNIYHQLTPSIIDALNSLGVPVVLTLHDYKVVCPSYELFVDGSPCRRCVHGSVANAIIHQCIKGSVAASAIGATEASVTRHRGSYAKVDRFVAPSSFIAGVMAEGGYSANKVKVVRNFLPDQTSGKASAGDKRSGFLFVGRLEEVKGIRLLLDAWSEMPPDVKLKLMGTGPLQEVVKTRANSSTNVSYLGFGSAAEVRRELDSALALIVPSVWEENCPMNILEARVRSCAVIGTNRGGIPELIRHDEDGLLTIPGSAEGLLKAVLSLADNPSRAYEMGRRGAVNARRMHAPEVYYAGLMNVYEEAIDARR